MGIVFAEQFVGELHHFHTFDDEAFLFKQADDFSGQTALQGAGFEQNERFL